MNWRVWLITLGGAGQLPKAPGTYGSLLITLVVGGAYFEFTRGAPSVDPLGWNSLLVVGVLLFGVLSVWMGPYAVAHFGRKDPGPFVLDEAAGICVTFLFLPVIPTVGIGFTSLAAFLAFRLFDILKPPPCHALEKLPAGWGILADDLMAGVYANLLCQIALRLFFD